MHSDNDGIVIHRGRSHAYNPIPPCRGLDHTGGLVTLEGRNSSVLIQVSAYLDILYGVDEIRRKIR